ncbi:hypothetical protein B6U74_04200 [Candidatus Bathyarchaeota archaeon ex4484_205]|nr:MAG: hypothetical protein B6U74_04200 [Candidatus Bathyarchaeota archaeon ex4484_205]RLG69307.1 MAG: hypothetical protein DRN93_00450 [archaeon]HDN18304.1 DUF126 domain-containing protein [Candidatus Bathyarchaeota archaeon]
MILRGKSIVEGEVEGPLVYSHEPITFFGGVNPESGKIVEEGHPLKGVEISGKILILPRGKGSTVGAYVIYYMKKKGTAPLGFVLGRFDTIIVSGCIISEIPLLILEDGEFEKTSDDVTFGVIRHNELEIYDKNLKLSRRP